MSNDKKIQSCICFPTDSTQQVSLTYNANPQSPDTIPIEIISTTVPHIKIQDNENIKKMNEIYNYLTTIETQTPSFQLTFDNNILTGIIDSGNPIEINGMFEGIDNLEKLIQKINTLTNEIRQNEATKIATTTRNANIQETKEAKSEPIIADNKGVKSSTEGNIANPEIIINDITQNLENLDFRFQTIDIEKEINSIEKYFNELNEDIDKLKTKFERIDSYREHTFDHKKKLKILELENLIEHINTIESVESNSLNKRISEYMNEIQTAKSTIDEKFKELTALSLTPNTSINIQKLIDQAKNSVQKVDNFLLQINKKSNRLNKYISSFQNQKKTLEEQINEINNEKETPPSTDTTQISGELNKILVDYGDLNFQDIVSNYQTYSQENKTTYMKNINEFITKSNESISELRKLKEKVDEKYKPQIDEYIEKINTEIQKIEEIKTKLESPSDTSPPESAELSATQNDQNSSSGGKYSNNSNRNKKTKKRKNRKFRKTRANK